MNWTQRVREAFVDAAQAPDEDVLEELAQHAQATFEAARAGGCSIEEANARVADLLARWRADVGALQRPVRAAAASRAAQSARGGSIVPPLPSAPPPPLRAGADQASRARALAALLADLRHDLRYALRLLRRQPRYALLTILTLALGIGATTTLFSV